MQCKHGDLAIIVDDFDGCKGNIGLIVRVKGPTEVAVEMVCWQITPLSGQKLWLLDDGQLTKENVSDQFLALHPDKWLLPIRAERVSAKNLELELS